MSKCGKGKKALANKSKYEAYGKWAKHRYEYIWDKLHEYTEKLKHLLTVQLGIVGGFIIYLTNNKAITNTPEQLKFLYLGTSYFLISILFSIAGLYKNDIVKIKLPTTMDIYREDTEAEKYVWIAITDLASGLLKHNNKKSELYRCALQLFGAGIASSATYFIFFL